MDAADDIGRRFGTPVALIFEGDVAGLDDGPHAFVELVADDSSSPTPCCVTSVLAGPAWPHSSSPTTPAWPTNLKAGGGSVMRCAAWLSLGEQVGATLD